MARFKKQLSRFSLIILAMMVIEPAMASDERAWPIITFVCDKDKGEVKIKNEVKWGEAGKNFPFNAAQGTYNPWSLVKMEDRGKRRLISESDQLKLTCELGKSKYSLVVRPKIFNVNFFGKCGDRLSVKVSIYKDESILLENKEMEKFCHGNAPVLRGIKVIAKNSKVKLYEISRSRFY